MKVVLHKRFSKMVASLPPKTKTKTVERMTLFANNPRNRLLRSHALNTPYKGSYSVYINGDVRAIYQLIDDRTALFTHIGTHSQLYR